jgi:hypothetical protein
MQTEAGRMVEPDLGNPRRVTTGSGNYAVHPSLAIAAGGRLHAVWYDRDALGVDQIFHAAR